MEHQLVTTEQLARLYDARNAANKRMGQALRAKDKTLVRLATEDATRWNQVYASALRQYKRQQKSAARERQRITMIRFYLDALEAAEA